jgi:SAM-dependent methyltransferase
VLISHLQYLRCPHTGSKLTLSSVTSQSGDRIKDGILTSLCAECDFSYPIVNYVPRFVSHGQYAHSFGLQWNTYSSTQIDSSCLSESSIRWEQEIGWSESSLSNKTIVEFGCGSGRFLDIVSSLNPALAVGIDISDAVDSAYHNLGLRNNVLIVQADIFNPPFATNFFNFAYSIGVLHHTPDPERAFHSMVSLVADKGRVGLSLYEICLFDRPSRNSFRQSLLEFFWSANLLRVEFFRLFTTRLPTPIMISYCRFIVPPLHYLNLVPVFRYLRYLLPSTCYRNLPVEWSMLDTHDTYATKIVHMYRHKDIFHWFKNARLINIDISNSISGWVSLTGSVSNH